MALFASSRPSIRVRVLPRFPAKVIQGAGIGATVASGTMTLGLDFPGMVDNAGVADPSRFTTAVFNRDTLGYEELRLDQFPVPAETANRTPRGDANYTILNTDRFVALTATLTAPRAWSLPAASSVPAGRLLVIQDEVGGISATNTLTIATTGADTINGASTFVLATVRGGVELRSNGSNAWSSRPLADLAVTTAKIADLAVTTAKIVDKAVTAAKMEDLAQSTISGRAAGAGTGARQALTPAQAKAVLAIGTGDVTGLGGAATLNVGTTAGTVAAGDDGRFAATLLKASNLSDLASVATALTNLGFSYVAGANSYVRLGSSGIIVQWGTKAAGTADFAITFPLAFPTACRAVVGVSSLAVSTTALVTVHCTDISATGFTWRGRAVVGATAPAAETTGGSWIALGY